MLDVPSRPTLFLDESGDPNPRSVSVDYPVFVLGGVICDSEYADTVVREALNSIKQELIGATNFTLHTAEFKRYRGPFRRLRHNDPMRALLRRRILTLLNELDYSVVACVVHKGPLAPRSRQTNANLYHLALPRLVEQFCDVIGQAETGARFGGNVIVEARRPQDDRAVLREWEAMLDRGTPAIRGQVIERRIRSVKVERKSNLNPGLELADLVVSPIGRHAIGKPDTPEWEVVRERLLRRPEGNFDGYGLITLQAPTR